MATVHPLRAKPEIAGYDTEGLPGCQQSRANHRAFSNSLLVALREAKGPCARARILRCAQNDRRQDSDCEKALGQTTERLQGCCLNCNSLSCSVFDRVGGQVGYEAHAGFPGQEAEEDCIGVGQVAAVIALIEVIFGAGEVPGILGVLAQVQEEAERVGRELLAGNEARPRGRSNPRQRGGRGRRGARGRACA